MGSGAIGGGDGIVSREARQRKILDIIAAYDVDTQEELVTRLAAEGFSVTQATVSRDIRDMNLIKTTAADGKGYRYTAQPRKDTKAERFISVFRNTVLSIRAAENLVVIKTETGSANAAAETIDRMNMDCILGVIAGDNTIFVAVDEIENAALVAENWRKFCVHDCVRYGAEHRAHRQIGAFPRRKPQHPER